MPSIRTQMMSTAPQSSQGLPSIRAGVFDDLESADRAVASLFAKGFRAKQMSVVCSDATKRHHFAGLHEEEPSGAHTGSAAATGGAIGLIIGGVAALTGIVATGGVGLFAAGALAGAGVTGSFIGAMMTRGVEREYADFYDQELRRGQILLVVEDHSETPHLDDAEQAMQDAGAIPFSLREG